MSVIMQMNKLSNLNENFNDYEQEKENKKEIDSTKKQI